METALANFNAAKAQRLEDISNQGKIAKATNDKLSEQIATTEEQIGETETELAELNGKIAEAKATTANLAEEEKAYTMDDAYLKAQELKQVIEASILQLQETTKPKLDSLNEEVQTIDAAIEANEHSLAQIAQRESGLKRIDELKLQERKMASEYERLEQELFLTEQFVRTKVTLLEDKINSSFQQARFKLFNILVNGGIEECCETTYKGVPYGSALNNSAQINVGLDVINTLSEHFNFVAPIWMDNAEAVTQMLPTKGQQIRLYVSEADKILRVENKKEVE